MLLEAAARERPRKSRKELVPMKKLQLRPLYYRVALAVLALTALAAQVAFADVPPTP